MQIFYLNVNVVWFFNSLNKALNKLYYAQSISCLIEFAANKSSKCITRDTIGNYEAHLNEENVKVLTRSAADIAVNKIEQSFQSALDFYYSQKLGATSFSPAHELWNPFAGEARRRPCAEREIRREKSFCSLLRGVKDDAVSRTVG